MWSDMVVKYKDKIIVNTKQCLFNSADGINAIFGPTGIETTRDEDADRVWKDIAIESTERSFEPRKRF